MSRIPCLESPVVYFARLQDGRVKIGFTVNLIGRMGELRTAFCQRIRLLGVMPGSRTTERETHGRFIHLSRGGELFEAAPELLDFINTSTSLPDGWYDFSEWITAETASKILGCRRRHVGILADRGIIRRRKTQNRAYSLEDVERLSHQQQEAPNDR
jgi:hypothetical protein